MNCRVDRDPKGNILKVYDQDGNESQLFMELAQVPGTTLETALEQYISTLEPELEFSRVEINNGLTSHMFTLGDDKVGSIRTKPFKDGVKVDQAIVKEEYRGQGVGTELYLETIRNLMVDGKKLYSDTSRTEFAERIWERLVSQGLAVKNEDGTYETILIEGVTPETTIDDILSRGVLFQIVGEKGVKINLEKVKDSLTRSHFIKMTAGDLKAVDVLSNYTGLSLSGQQTYTELGEILNFFEKNDVLDSKLPYSVIEEDYGVTESDIRAVYAKIEDKFNSIDSELYRAENVLRNLNVAKEMTEGGKTPLEVRLATGWEIAPDGKWRYEIPDFDVKNVEITLNEELPNFDSKVGKYKLEDLIKNSKELFNHYPTLKDTEVIFVGESLGNFNMAVSEGKIYIDYEQYTRNNKFSDNSRVLSHEVQHLIQDIEGFAGGGSMQEFYPAVVEFIKQIGEGTYNRESEDARDGVLLRDVQDVFEERIREEDREIATILFGQRELDIIAFGLYQRLYGEVEARNVQSRYGLSNVERLNTLLSERSWEDIQDNQTIIKFGEGSASYMVNNARTESYKTALNIAQGQDIQVGVIKNGEFQPLETRSSNLNPTTPIGWVNNVVAEGIVKETQYIENGQARLEVEGDSAIKRVINEEIVKDFALENDMKAEINEDGTFTISSLGVPDNSEDKVVYEQVYDNFFGQQTAQGVFIETDSQLVDKITSFLEKLGFSMVSIEAYKQKYLDKNGVLPNAEALVDLANQVVAFKDGKITEDTLTEEFAHIIIEGLPIEEIQPLLDQVHETKEWADHAETYQQIYKNDVLVRKEILGKIVANGLQQKTKAQNIFQSAWTSIKNFINSVIRPGFESDVSNLTDRVHDMLVRQDASSLEDLSKRKFRMYRVDNTMPDLVRTALNQIEEGERQLRTSGSDKYLISEAYNNIDQGRSDLAVVNMLDLAKRQARYVRQALDSASVNGSLLSGEERVVANNLKTVIQPIISRIRIEAENDTNLSKYLQHAKEVSDDISMLDTSVSDQVIDDLIDDLFVSNPDLHNQTFDGKSARDYFRDAFKVAESDTNYLFSMIGSIAHAKDALLGMLAKVLKNMTMRAHFKFHDSATAFNAVLEKAGFLPKDLRKFYHKDGYMLSAWDWAEYNIKLNEAKKSALETAGITYEGDFDPKTNYVADATPDQATIYRDTLMKLRSEFETKKYNQEYYDKMDAKMKSLNLSQKTMDRITAFGLERSHIMRDVKRDEKGRPIFTKRDTEALEAYNIERRRAKSFYDSEGKIKDGIKAHMEEVSDSLEVGGLFYTLDKDAGEDAITAFEMVKYDRASAPSSSHSGISQFLDIMKGMSVSQAKEYAKANINMNPVYEDFTPLEIKGGFEVEYEIYKKLSAQRKAILNRYRDPKNASNILFHQMDKAIQAKVRDLSENIAVQRRKIEFQETDIADSRNEYGVNEAYKAWVKEEGFGANPQLEFEAALEHVPLHQKAYLNGLFNSLDLLLRGYEISSLESNRLNKEFGDLDFKQLSEEDIQIEKLESVKKRLAPYFMASVPASMNTKLDALNGARNTDQVIRVLKDLDDDPAVNMSMHYSFYEDVSADLNPEYNQNYKGGPVQPKMRNLEFEKLLNIAPGTYTLDDLGIPVMKQGYSESNDLIVYRALIEMNHQNLTLQGEAGHTNVFQAPQVSRTTTDKIMSVLAGDTKLLDTAKEMINEMKNFRIDDMMIGEVDGNGEALAKQGIRIVPKRFVRQLETTADVTDDLFFSMMLMNKESHLHKARKESVNQVMALDQAMTNRKYNNTSKQAQSTNSYKMFKSFVDSNMFGITEVANYKVNLPFVGSVDLAKVSKLLHQYVRNRNLAYNLVVPMTSWVTAEVGLLIEGWVKQYVDQGSLMGARKELARLTPNAFTESMDIIKTSKLSVIAERFDLFNMETSYQNAKYGAGIRSIGKVGYVAHTGANFSPIMTAMLGSLIGHRLYNGQFLNYDEFKSQVRTERNLSSKEADAEWAASQDQSFYNYIDAKGGQFDKKYQKFADDTGVELEQAKSMLDRYEIDIAIKTQKLSEVIDGNIRPEERSIAQRHFLLSFLTTHKGWMSIALARRFKDGHYNTSTNKWEEGHYMTGFRASKMMLKSLLDSKGNPNQAYKQILEDWKNAKPEERMNMQRMLIEMGVLTGLYTLLLMLTGFADDDENKDVSSIQFTAYIMERLVNETRSSQLGLGNEILNTIQDPVVGFKELRKLADISQLFDSEEVLRGRYQGLSGTSAYLLNAVPGGKAMHTISTGENIYYQRNAYKLYNSPDELQPLGLIIDTGDVNEIYGN